MANFNTKQNLSESIAVPLRRVVCFTLVAGYLDAVGFVDLSGIYAAAMTGNTIQLGIAFVREEWPRFMLVGATILSFFCGGLFSSYLRRLLTHPALELMVMAALVMAAQLVRIFVSDPLPLELPLLACSMAMQGETISRFGGLSIQTIVVTNNLLKFADGIVGRYIYFASDTRASISDVVIPGGAWLGYLIGAGAGTFASFSFSLPFIPPMLVLFLISADLLLTGTGRDEPSRRR